MIDCYQIHYSVGAYEELNEIYEYIWGVLGALKAASRIVKTIQNAIEGLRFMPERFALAEGRSYMGLPVRKMPVERYNVFYQVKKESLLVFIISILRKGRKVKKRLEEML